MSGTVIKMAAGTTSSPVNHKTEQLRLLATVVWAEMASLGIIPTPRAYDVWFTHRSLTHPALSQCIDAYVMQQKPLTCAVLDALHTRFVIGEDRDFDDVIAGAGDIQHEAESLAHHIAGGQESITRYGESLTAWASRLSDEPTIVSLVSAVASLTAETTRASERNRVLENQLSVAAGRISKLRQSLSSAKTEATIDPLTAVTNRKAFDARLKRILAQARVEPDFAVSVILFDIDHFKIFNDTYGHQTGDLVLRFVARLLSESVKGRDTVARYGGEEFAVLLVGADIAAATIVARQICDAIASKQLVQKSVQRPINQVTISAGVAQLHGGDNQSSWIDRADQALYRAKDHGRNRVCTEAELF